jgi:hypothetical protein
MWKIVPNIDTRIIIYTYKYIQDIFPKVELLEETKGGVRNIEVN